MLIITAPGQGAQTPGFLAPWLEVPGVAERLGAASELAGCDLIRYGTTADADEIRDTAIAQPLLVAAALATAGALAGTTLGLTDQQITIGRANDATLVLNDDYASTRHARLFPQDGQWIVEDLGSTNGTYLDRQKVTHPTPVPVGVPIRIGKTVLELRR